MNERHQSGGPPHWIPYFAFIVCDGKIEVWNQMYRYEPRAVCSNLAEAFAYVNGELTRLHIDGRLDFPPLDFEAHKRALFPPQPERAGAPALLTKIDLSDLDL
jgi:hypothetical protein